MAITRYTTPTLEFEFGLDLTNARLWLSIEQEDGVKIDKEVESFTVDQNVTSFSVTLTQEETAQFKPKKSVTIQLNYIFPDGSRDASSMTVVSTYDNLLNEVKRYAD